jgi:hypothetical protein
LAPGNLQKVATNSIGTASTPKELREISGADHRVRRSAALQPAGGRAVRLRPARQQRPQRLGRRHVGSRNPADYSNREYQMIELATGDLAKPWSYQAGLI